MSEEFVLLADIAIFSMYLLTRDLTIIAARKVKNVTTKKRSRAKLSLKNSSTASSKIHKYSNQKRNFNLTPMCIEYYS